MVHYLCQRFGAFPDPRAYAGDTFHIEVAAIPKCTPQARSAGTICVYPEGQGRCRRQRVIVQVFLQCRRLLSLQGGRAASGRPYPFVPGIMPIASSSQLIRFSDACGAEVPRWPRLRLQEAGG